MRTKTSIALATAITAAAAGVYTITPQPDLKPAYVVSKKCDGKFDYVAIISPPEVKAEGILFSTDFIFFEGPLEKNEAFEQAYQKLGLDAEKYRLETRCEKDFDRPRPKIPGIGKRLNGKTA